MAAADMEKKEILISEHPPSPTSPDSPSERIPQRLVICVDGTSYFPNEKVAPTNVYRIYSSITSGACISGDPGVAVNQIPLYYAGIGGADEVLSKHRLQAGVLGSGYQDQIRNIYEKCCELDEQDEVVFFGFSRGAYVIRAVAGLLHRFGALVTAGQPDFRRNFRKVIKETDKQLMRSGSLSLHHTNSVSSLSTTTSDDLKTGPKIRFVGAFDTIRASNDDNFDTSFKNSIQHFRHALALHEDRKALTPEPIFPEEFYGTDLRQTERTFVQALFIGSHLDMGGANVKAGLGLYPLQWMILEAVACGVTFDLDGRTLPSKFGGVVDKPLSVVFPKVADGKESARATFTAANGLVTTMQDLRNVHDQPKSREIYGIKLNTSPGTIRMKKPRTPFDVKGYLRGYCDYAPQGTIIHPSVYLLLDEHINVALDTKEAKLQRHLEEWREKMLGKQNGHVNFGFWGDDDVDSDIDPGAIRVLVCGNTGVGKSTLINKTFGVQVTQSSDRTRGIHDVKQEITFEGRPDLIVHDSGGFEAGADTEFLAIEEFLKEKSKTEDIAARLHVIWFCVEINSARTLQTATEKLFQAVGQYASDVPIVVVATKKDDFLDIEFSAKRKEMKKNQQPFDEEACDQHAEEKLQTRLEEVRHEMETVPGGRLDAIVAVSQDDDESIAFLSKTTSHCFDLDKVRLLYIRAQVTRIDLKIDLALCEVMRRYKVLLKTAAGVSFAFAGPTTHRKTAATKVCKAIMNCFGLPGVSAEAGIQALRQNVWNHLGIDLFVSLAECLTLMGYSGAAAAAGVPIWLATGAISIPLVVPATARLFLTMACDLILVLTMSFKEVALRQSGQPQERDVQCAARIYRLRGYSQHVQQDIKKLIPRTNVSASFKVDSIREAVETLIEEYKSKLIDSVDLPDARKLKIRSAAEDDDDESVSGEPDSAIHRDLSEVHRKVAELEGSQGVVELPASEQGISTELPVEEQQVELQGGNPYGSSDKRAELEDEKSTPRVHELPI